MPTFHTNLFVHESLRIDFFEMRRRVSSDRNDNIEFSYGPYGALIPNMAYEGAGFFHCINDTNVIMSQNQSKNNVSV